MTAVNRYMSDDPFPQGDLADGEPPADPESGKPSQASLLVELAADRYRLGLSERGDAFGVRHEGPNIARMLRGDRDSLRAELSAAYTDAHGKVPRAAALADALLVLEGRAEKLPREPVALRVARHGAAVVLDLGTPDGTAALVTRDGWTVEPSPVLFRRTALTDPLPEPVAGGALDELRSLLNVPDHSWPLLVAWLVCALLGERPCPVCALLGEQGSAKTTAAKLLAAVLDSLDALRAPPRDLEGWIVAADSSRVVGLDNLSRVPEWLSDAVCRTVTGEALVRRKLYTDTGVSRVAFRRPVILTAIDPGELRGDLADRLVAVELDRIPDDRRRLDADVWHVWQQAHPRVLGGLLDVTAQVLAAIPTVRLDRLPRMADYARVLAAVDWVLGTDGLAVYLNQRDNLARDVVDSDPFAAAVAAHVTDAGEWTGTAGQLLRALTPDKPPKDWPGNASAAGKRLVRIAPGLRAADFEVDYDKDARPRKWTMRVESAQKRDAPDAPDEQAGDQQERPVTSADTTRIPSRAPDAPAAPDGSKTPSDLQLDTSVTSDTSRRPISSHDPPANGDRCPVCGDLFPDYAFRRLVELGVITGARRAHPACLQGVRP